MKIRQLALGAMVGALSVTWARDAEARRETFLSEGHRIAVDVYGSSDSRGAVIVLHGAGGMLFDGPQSRRVAKALARAGMQTFVVHFFNRTGSIFVAGDSGLVQGYPEWESTVRDAITWVSEHHGHDRIGLYGYSLGGFLAVAVGAGNPAVSAIVEQSGGIWDRFTTVRKALPPVLVIHGRKDERVSFETNIRKIEALAAEHGTRLEILPFDAEGHRFSSSAMDSATRATVEFLRATLQ